MCPILVVVGKIVRPLSRKSRVWSYLSAIYTCMRGLYKLGENKGKKERRRCGEQISVVLAYDLRERGSILLICCRRVGIDYRERRRRSVTHFYQMKSKCLIRPESPRKNDHPSMIAARNEVFREIIARFDLRRTVTSLVVENGEENKVRQRVRAEIWRRETRRF